MADDELLTELELRALALTAELAGALSEIVGQERTRTSDLNELLLHIHAIQRPLMAQAAARAYPGHFRLLGGVV